MGSYSFGRPKGIRSRTIFLSQLLFKFSGLSPKEMTMNFAQLNPVAKSRLDAHSHNTTAWLIAAALVIVFSIAIYLDATSPSVTLEQLSFMSVYP
jgi:hypothetical protein